MPRRRKRRSIELPDVDERATGVIVARHADGTPRLDKRGLPILRRSARSDMAERWMTLLYAATSEMGMTPAARARMNQAVNDARCETKAKTKRRG